MIYCGPIIAPSSKHEEGDRITCLACHGDYNIQKLNSGRDELEFTGATDISYVPEVDFDVVDYIISKTPKKIHI